MNRKELLDLIPVGKGSPNSSKYYFKLGPLAGLRLSVVMAEDDTDWDALWKEIEPELDALVKAEEEWAEEEARLATIPQKD